MLTAIAQLGAMFTSFVQQLGELTVFALRVVVTGLWPPLRFRQVLDEFYKLGVLSLVIICVSGLAVGMVLALLAYSALARFGAEEVVGAIVGLGLVRELGPVFTALLTTGRAGSATTAEIGTMVATEQLDGLRMMSVDPVDYVIGPKAVTMALVMPLLSALFITCGIFGGYLVGVGLMGIDGGTFLTSLESNINFRHDIIGSILKALLFGVIVGLVSTYKGYKCAPTSSGVSSATTSTVVTASVAVLISDYFFTALWEV